MDEPEKSESGTQIYRYTAIQEKTIELTNGDDEPIELIF
jgi:hypothetical protein